MTASTESKKLTKKRLALLKTIADFDVTDAYHLGEIPENDQASHGFYLGYYAAMDRVAWLLLGEIKDWTSPAPQGLGEPWDLVVWDPIEP